MTIKKLISENEWARNRSGGVRGMARWVKCLLRKSEGLSSDPQSPCRVGTVVHSVILHSFSSAMRQEVGTGDPRIHL